MKTLKLSILSILLIAAGGCGHPESSETPFLFPTPKPYGDVIGNGDDRPSVLQESPDHLNPDLELFEEVLSPRTLEDVLQLRSKSRNNHWVSESDPILPEI